MTMPSIKDIMQTMEYGPAPESNSEVKAWLEARAAGLGHYIKGSFTAAEGELIEGRRRPDRGRQPGDRRSHRTRRQGRRGGR